MDQRNNSWQKPIIAPVRLQRCWDKISMVVSRFVRSLWGFVLFFPQLFHFLTGLVFWLIAWHLFERCRKSKKSSSAGESVDFDDL